MADDRGDEQTGSANTEDLAARLAEVHRRTEELAAQVASFHAEATQLTGQSEPADPPAPAETPEPEPERRHRPRPSPDAPRVYDDPETGPEQPAEEQPAEEQDKQTSGDGESKVDTSQLEKEIDAALAAPKRPGGESKDAKGGDKADTDGGKDGEKPKRRSGKGLGKWGSRLRKLLIVAVIIVAAALALRTWVVAPYYVPSASMEPTLHGCASCNDDHLLVQKLSYDFHDPQRGDIVVFDKPSKWHVSESVLIKRVIGVPGDRIVIKHKQVFVNGQRLDETYVNKRCHGTAPAGYKNGTKVPKGELFVMGDNRCNSDDSREQGPVPIDDVIGKAFLIIWPFSRFGSP